MCVCFLYLDPVKTKEDDKGVLEVLNYHSESLERIEFY